MNAVVELIFGKYQMRCSIFMIRFQSSVNERCSIYLAHLYFRLFLVSFFMYTTKLNVLTLEDTPVLSGLY